MLENFDDTLQNYFSSINHQYVPITIIILSIIYIIWGVQNISPNILEYCNSLLFKLIALFLIIYCARANSTVGIILAIAFMVTLITINKNEMDQTMYKILNSTQEHMTNLNQSQEFISLEPTYLNSSEMTIDPSSIDDIRREMRDDSTNDLIDNQYMGKQSSFYPQYMNASKMVYDKDHPKDEPGAGVGAFDGGGGLYASI
jgi:hypothetical protein